jgi:hypothetical protein
VNVHRTAISPRRHARLARNLIEACGGLEEAASACRVRKSSLSLYQCPQDAATMPADVMADLEAYCGEPIYSREIADARPAGPMGGDVVVETHEVVLAAARLLPLALAVKSGTPGAQAAFDAAVAALSSEVDDVEAIATVVPMRGPQ